MDFQYSADELELKNRVRRFAREKLLPIRNRVDSKDEYSPEIIRLLADEGLFRYVTPEEYGGVGISSVAASIIREELVQVCTHADVTFIMSLFASQAITKFGTEEQKHKYLPALASGNMVGTASITEPAAGTDVSAVVTTATPEGNYYIFNGIKSFCTMGAAAEACIVIATVDPSLGHEGVSAFIVDCKNAQPGLKTHVMKLISPHPLYQIEFKNYQLPKENILGKEGQGMEIVLSMLGRARTTVGAAAVGLAVSAYEEALDYAQSRIAFKRPLVKFQAIQLHIADMLTDIEAARLLVLRAAWSRDREESEEAMMQASMAKLFATEAAQRVIDEAVQIHGGYGVLQEVRVEYLYRTIRALRIYEGTSDIQRLTITRSVLKLQEKQ
ncbi:acyl-CoA dehydrogenase family protein [Chloroflexota bacterium]